MAGYTYTTDYLTSMRNAAISAMESTLNSCQVFQGYFTKSEYKPVVFPIDIETPTLNNAVDLIGPDYVDLVVTAPLPTKVDYGTIPNFEVNAIDFSVIPGPETTLTPLTNQQWTQEQYLQNDGVTTGLMTSVQGLIKKTTEEMTAYFTAMWMAGIGGPATQRRTATENLLISMIQPFGTGFTSKTNMAQAAYKAISTRAANDKTSQEYFINTLLTELASKFANHAIVLGVKNESMLAAFTESLNSLALHLHTLAVKIYRDKIDAEIIRFDSEVEYELDKLRYRKQRIDMIRAENQITIEGMKGDILQKTSKVPFVVQAMNIVNADYSSNVEQAKLDLKEAKIQIAEKLSRVSTDLNNAVRGLNSMIESYSHAALSAATEAAKNSTASQINLVS